MQLQKITCEAFSELQDAINVETGESCKFQDFIKLEYKDSKIVKIYLYAYEGHRRVYEMFSGPVIGPYPYVGFNEEPFILTENEGLSHTYFLMNNHATIAWGANAFVFLNKTVIHLYRDGIITHEFLINERIPACLPEPIEITA